LSFTPPGDVVVDRPGRSPGGRRAGLRPGAGALPAGASSGPRGSLTDGPTGRMAHGCRAAGRPRGRSN